jgi:predicted nucleic acid-binding protein
MARAQTLVDALREGGHESFVADTAPLVYRFQRRSAPALTAACDALFDAVERGELTCFVSGVSVTELLVAPFRAGPGAVEAIDAFLHQPLLGIVGVGEAVARRGARLLAGRRTRLLADALIAATALEARVPLVTNDRRLSRSGVVEALLVSDFA